MAELRQALIGRTMTEGSAVTSIAQRVVSRSVLFESVRLYF